MSGFLATINSIRFRLTAWYSLLLTVVLFTAGYGLLALMQQSLREDLDQRLLDTARTIIADEGIQRFVDEDQSASGRYADDSSGPNLSGFPGTVIQINNERGEMVYGTFPFCQVPYSPPASDDSTQYLSTHGGCGTQLRVLTQAIQLRYPVSGGLAMVSQPATLVIAQSLEPLDETMGSLQTAISLIGVIGISLAVVGGWLLAGRVLAPIDDVTDAAAIIAESNRTGASLSNRLDVPPTGDEVARLSETFNRMLDRLQVAFDSREQFVANASHELRTPLAAIRGNLDVLSRQFDRLQETRELAEGAGQLDAAFLDNAAEAFGDMQRESARMGRLLDDLLFLARSDAGADREQAPTMEPVRLDLVALAAVRVSQNLASGQQILTSVSPVTINGDADRLTQLTLILLDNAIRYTEPDAEIMVSVSVDDGKAELRVADAGDGIAPEHLPHIFDRFYRVDTARSRASGGSGLGLAIAKVIAEAHQADITVQSAMGEGTVFILRFPLVQEPPARTSPETSATSDSETISPSS